MRCEVEIGQPSTSIGRYYDTLGTLISLYFILCSLDHSQSHREQIRIHSRTMKMLWNDIDCEHRLDLSFLFVSAASNLFWHAAQRTMNLLLLSVAVLSTKMASVLLNIASTSTSPNDILSILNQRNEHRLSHISTVTQKYHLNPIPNAFIKHDYKQRWRCNTCFLDFTTCMATNLLYFHCFACGSLHLHFHTCQTLCFEKKTRED